VGQNRKNHKKRGGKVPIWVKKTVIRGGKGSNGGKSGKIFSALKPKLVFGNDCGPESKKSSNGDPRP